MDQEAIEGVVAIENVILENPQLLNHRTIEVYEIQDNNPGPSSTKCCLILIAWSIVIISLIILKTLF